MPDLSRLSAAEVEALYLLRWCDLDNETIQRIVYVRRHQAEAPFAEDRLGARKLEFARFLVERGRLHD